MRITSKSNQLNQSNKPELRPEDYYELVLRENPGLIGGWLVGITRTRHHRSVAATESQSNQEQPTSWVKTTYYLEWLQPGFTTQDQNDPDIWHWLPTKKLALRSGSKKINSLIREQVSKERSFKYQEKYSEEELGLRE